jgi:hypothetical protein
MTGVRRSRAISMDSGPHLASQHILLRNSLTKLRAIATEIARLDVREKTHVAQ